MHKITTRKSASEAASSASCQPKPLQDTSAGRAQACGRGSQDAGSDVRTCQISTLTNHKQAFDHALPTRSCVEVGVGSSPAPAHWKTTVVSFKFAGDATCWKDCLTRSPPMQAAEAASSHSDGSTPSPLTRVLAPVFVRISPLAKAGVQGFMKKLRKESQT